MPAYSNRRRLRSPVWKKALLNPRRLYFSPLLLRQGGWLAIAAPIFALGAFGFVCGSAPKVCNSELTDFKPPFGGMQP